MMKDGKVDIRIKNLWLEMLLVKTETASGICKLSEIFVVITISQRWDERYRLYVIHLGVGATLPHPLHSSHRHNCHARLISKLPYQKQNSSTGHRTKC